jgi:hypothetical protein
MVFGLGEEEPTSLAIYRSGFARDIAFLLFPQDQRTTWLPGNKYDMAHGVHADLGFGAGLFDSISAANHPWRLVAYDEFGLTRRLIRRRTFGDPDSGFPHDTEATYVQVSLSTEFSTTRRTGSRFVSGEESCQPRWVVVMNFWAWGGRWRRRALRRAGSSSPKMSSRR